MRKAFRFEGDMLSSSILKAALAWARHGGKIIALHGIDEEGKCTCGKPSCRSPGKHPISDLFPKGQHSATSSAVKIRRAFKKYPLANFGVILPPELVVLDVDGPEGAKTFKALDLPPTLSVRTGRGTHHYFRTTEGLPKKKAPSQALISRIVTADISSGRPASTNAVVGIACNARKPLLQSCPRTSRGL